MSARDWYHSASRGPAPALASAVRAELPPARCAPIAAIRLLRAAPQPVMKVIERMNNNVVQEQGAQRKVPVSKDGKRTRFGREVGGSGKEDRTSRACASISTSYLCQDSFANILSLHSLPKAPEEQNNDGVRDPSEQRAVEFEFPAAKPLMLDKLSELASVATAIEPGVHRGCGSRIGGELTSRTVESHAGHVRGNGAVPAVGYVRDPIRRGLTLVHQKTRQKDATGAGCLPTGDGKRERDSDGAPLGLIQRGGCRTSTVSDARLKSDRNKTVFKIFPALSYKEKI
ncbi:hypothetical protein FB451DRAFT_1167468 [Mycena latifolia]|nr:hypothetical protein FB451DRAFT_1167468 [Mycena latifolia]